MTAPCVIGIDAGGTKLLGGVVDEQLVVHHRVHRLWRGGDRQQVLDVMVEAVEEAIAAAGGEVAAIGFGIPSLLDWERGVSLACVHLPLEDVPFRDLMSERLGLPVVVDNDANCALLAEARAGAAAGVRDALLLTLGTGIGGGLLLDGRIYRGSRGSGAELGHVVVELDGHECSCGNRGCLETLASGSAIAAAARTAARRDPESALGKADAAGREITGSLVTELAHDGDEAAQGVLAEAGRALGAGLSGLANALNPERIVIGGGAAAAGELLLEPARAELAARTLAPNADVSLGAAHFGEESGMLGAALLALEAVA